MCNWCTIGIVSALINPNAPIQLVFDMFKPSNCDRQPVFFDITIIIISSCHTSWIWLSSIWFSQDAIHHV